MACTQQKTDQCNSSQSTIMMDRLRFTHFTELSSDYEFERIFNFNYSN
jgi:hypothetical protein